MNMAFYVAHIWVFLFIIYTTRQLRCVSAEVLGIEKSVKDTFIGMPVWVIVACIVLMNIPFIGTISLTMYAFFSGVLYADAKQRNIIPTDKEKTQLVGKVLKVLTTKINPED